MGRVDYLSDERLSSDVEELRTLIRMLDKQVRHGRAIVTALMSDEAKKDGTRDRVDEHFDNANLEDMFLLQALPSDTALGMASEVLMEDAFRHARGPSVDASPKKPTINQRMRAKDW